MKNKTFTLLLWVSLILISHFAQAQPYYFSPNIQTFTSTYGCTGCHDASSPSSGFNQLTYAAILTGGVQCAPDIRPFDEAGSPYVIKIDCSVPLTCGSSNMPLGSPCTVSAADIALVRAWIRAGALGDNTFCQSFTGSPLVHNFTGFGGGGFNAAPSATQLHSKVWNFSGFSDFFKPGQSNTGNDFGRGTTTPGVPVTGGIYGCTHTTGNQSLWIQPSTNDFSGPNGGTMNLQICNNSGSSITTLNINYDLLVYNDRDRANSFNFFYSTNGSTFIQVGALDYTSPSTASGTPEVVTVPRSTTLTGLSIANGAMFYLRWFGNDVSGVGERDEFGLDNLVVSLPGTCNITGVSSTTAVCSGTSATFNVSFTPNSGSGTYNVINTANSSILATGSSSPIAVTYPNSVGGSINVNVVDAFIPSCTSTPVSVTLPNCTPVCAITSVGATTATCSGTNAVFNVSFAVANGSGIYNVVNTANSSILATGSSSPISVTFPNSVGGSININVVDASIPTCLGTPVLVALPDCTPVCAITSVSANTATCSGTSAVFNVSFNVANGSGVYNVINTANNSILASGSSSPIGVSLPNNLTAGSITVNVTDASNSSCAGIPVVVALPDCTPPIFCGDIICNGVETYCTCPGDCPCVISSEFVNFDIGGSPIVSTFPVAFCQTEITGEVNPSQPHYLYIPIRVNGVSCATYNLTADEGSFFVLNGNTLQSTATIGNMAVVWLRMSQAEINLAGGTTSINFSGSGGNCLTNRTITWSSVTNYTGNVSTTCKSALVIRVFLTGAYNFVANNGLMRLQLNALLPLSSPYNAAPWNAPSASVTQMPADISDWVLVELRNPLNDNLIESQAGLLAADGFVRNILGHNGLTFVAMGSFKVVVKHRNHVAIISATSIDPNGGVANLTIPANVSGGNGQLANLGDTGLYGLYPGDVNHNGVVTFSDYNAYINTGVLLNTYNSSDCNMDGQVNSTDFNFMRPYFQQMGLTPIRY